VRHARSGKKLGRDAAHRKALYANLAGAVIEHGRIKTTVTKAKAVKPIAERLITLGGRGDLHARRQAVALLRSKEIVHKLFDEVGPAFASRPGGYLRITRIGPRPGDAAEMAYLELVDSPLVFRSTPSRASAAEVDEDELDEGEELEGEELEGEELEGEELEGEELDASAEDEQAESGEGRKP
jgi:large subunit ribosomal protein L17